MAGIYIPGMEMPRACVWREDGHLRTCPLYDIDGYCGAINSEACHKEEEHHPDCPAFFVPDHGRLGDLDKLEGEMRLLAKHQTGYRQQGILGCCETVRSAPAIIPADKEA